jgi:heme/copper-type cytochrome/quinol oxidase subunit 4
MVLTAGHLATNRIVSNSRVVDMSRTPEKANNVIFYVCWVLIVAISVHDGYLVVLNRESIASFEENPIGRWLIAANSGGIAYLLIAKSIGTTLTASILLWSFWSRPRFTLVITSAVASVQVLLLLYLSTY